MAHFESLEEMVEGERRAVEVAKQQVYKERLRVNEQLEKAQALVEQVQGQLSGGGMGGGAVGMAEVERIRAMGGQQGPDGRVVEQEVGGGPEGQFGLEDASSECS